MYACRKLGIDNLERYDTIAVLDKIAFPADAPPDTKTGDWWAYYDGKTPIAYCGLRPSNNFVNSGYLCRAGVLPLYRGHSLQLRMIRLRERYARSLGWEMLVTDTSNDNIVSSNNLIKAGYRLFRPMYFWSFVGANYWYKKLRKKNAAI